MGLSKEEKMVKAIQNWISDRPSRKCLFILFGEANEKTNKVTPICTLDGNENLVYEGLTEALKDDNLRQIVTECIDTALRIKEDESKQD